MKVMVGSTVIDSDDEPVMLLLTKEERQTISEMGVAVYFCSYPEGMTYDEVERFMKKHDVNLTLS